MDNLRIHRSGQSTISGGISVGWSKQSEPANAPTILEMQAMSASQGEAHWKNSPASPVLQADNALSLRIPVVQGRYHSAAFNWPSITSVV
jgi:hypothetical protein